MPLCVIQDTVFHLHILKYRFLGCEMCLLRIYDKFLWFIIYFYHNLTYITYKINLYINYILHLILILYLNKNKE